MLIEIIAIGIVLNNLFDFIYYSFNHISFQALNSYSYYSKTLKIEID